MKKSNKIFYLAIFFLALAQTSFGAVQNSEIFQGQKLNSLDIFTDWKNFSTKDLKEIENNHYAFLDNIKKQYGNDQVAMLNAVNNYFNAQKDLGNSNNSNNLFSKYKNSPHLLKYAALKYLGFSTENLRIVSIRDKGLSENKKVVAVLTEEEIYILDENHKVSTEQSFNRYQAVYSMNENNWWKYNS